MSTVPKRYIHCPACGGVLAGEAIAMLPNQKTNRPCVECGVVLAINTYKGFGNAVRFDVQFNDRIALTSKEERTRF